MSEYLLWGQIQDRLSAHYSEFGTVYSFYQAVRELYHERKTICEEALPPVDLDAWDSDDPAAFEAAFRQTALSFDAFQKAESLLGCSAHGNLMDMVPVRIAWDQAEGMHSYNAFQIIYVLGGTGDVQVKGSTIHLKAGVFCMIPPQLLHDVIADRDSRIFSFLLSEVTVENTLYKLLRYESLLSDLFRYNLQSCTAPLTFLMPPTVQIRRLLGAMWSDYYSGKQYSSEYCADLLELLFILLLRSQRRTDPSERTDASILAILQYIQGNFRSTSLNEVAAKFHYRANYLGKKIKRSTGRSFIEIVRELRINEAKHLLLHTTLVMEKIAERSGYSNLVHFYRDFRAAAGETPGEYRRQGWCANKAEAMIAAENVSADS